MKSEFLSDPGMTICLAISSSGETKTFCTHLFQIKHALHTKLFLDISRLTFGGKSVCRLDAVFTDSKEKIDIGWWLLRVF